MTNNQWYRNENFPTRRVNALIYDMTTLRNTNDLRKDDYPRIHSFETDNLQQQIIMSRLNPKRDQLL